MEQKFQRKVVRLGNCSKGITIPNYLIKAGLITEGQEYTVTISSVE